MTRKEISYKGYLIKPVYKHKWCVYEPGPECHNVFGARSGTVFPDIKISVNRYCTYSGDAECL